MDTITVDKINLLLLLSAGVIAYVIPFELLLISYAFLGPLHYLTEISWLHDRKYFTINKSDPMILTIASLAILFFGAAILPQSAELVWILIILAFCTTFLRSWWHRIVVILVGLLCLLPLFGTTASYSLAVMIPTVIHVFLFTLFFMILGALRSSSTFGFVNVLLFILISALLLIVSPSEISIWPALVTEGYPFFVGISEALASLFPFATGDMLVTIASFLAFAYTYHYLNWFSKTSIIEWHRISTKRALIIGFLYAISVGLYLEDYTLGLLVLLSLSFLHVILELPLNFKSITGLVKYANKISLRSLINK